MKENFLKFPPTPHLAELAGVSVRDDKVLSRFQCDGFLQHDLVVEEKIDGANLGISFDVEGNIQAQNRGGYLDIPGTGQWKRLEGWLSLRLDTLFEALSDQYILFGEWCYAQHSIFYDSLPDWFLCFDIYDKQSDRFLSTNRRDTFCEEMRVVQVPIVARGRFTLSGLEELLNRSKFADQPAEGLYLRLDQDEWLIQRAKLVRPEFVQSMEQHWSRSSIKKNRLHSSVQG